MARRGLTTGDLVRATGLTRSALTGWRRGRSLTIGTARSMAELFGVSLLDVLVGMHVLTSEEAQLRPVVSYDPATIPDDELVAEVGRRLRHRLWASRSRPEPAIRLDKESNACSSSGDGGSPRPPQDAPDGSSG
ncbi:DNA-binding XRE family transcriptional regulator [Saccharothrix variisporea]|uniref:DNA-binding XRE family transcriptional regulator n=1 Tax=Saccharothrix variisporea TaxID=543527 RepID=A0A495X2V5_9PSEU|nr:DNA-binding XRE family transcriptional regulator [Saccharothrix variisporea]